MGLFNDRTTAGDSQIVVPVWFMRQAGRYHSHYQKIKDHSDFMTMCKDPKLACEVTMGPVNDFDFDAAILFSDILFPLQQLGMGLSYLDGGPKLEMMLKNEGDLGKLKIIQKADEYYKFQAEALMLIKSQLPEQKTLLGFVGAPFTLYSYAVEGSHAGNLVSSKKGFYDNRYKKFMEKLIPELTQNMIIQSKAGADAMCLFDTAAGELCLEDYRELVIPILKDLTKEFKRRCPGKKLIYYSKFTHVDYLKSIEDDNIDVLGIDWRHNLAQLLDDLGKDYYVQGNIDPAWLHLPWNILEKKLLLFWEKISSSINLDHWICGLGHGVLIQTPEDNVRKAVQLIHSTFEY